MGVLDLPAEAFLTFYLMVVAVSVALAVAVRTALAGSGSAGAEPDLDVLDIAYLSGGPARTADTVLVGLLDAGTATIAPRGKWLVIEPSAAIVPRTLEPFRFSVRGEVTRRRFHTEVKPQLRAIRDRLIAAGLVPAPGAAAAARLTTVLVFLVPIALGAAKIYVGASRGRPTGILAALVVLTAMLALIFQLRPHLRTRAGSAALAASRALHSRAARAPVASEIMLAFALGGAAVLAGTPLAAFATQIPTPGSGSSSDGGSSDGGGGSGCGGCST